MASVEAIDKTLEMQEENLNNQHTEVQTEILRYKKLSTKISEQASKLSVKANK